MKIVLLFVISYVVFLVQVTLGRFAPELAAIVIIAVAWFERRYLGLVLGFFFGALFGLLNPNLLGLDLIIYTSLGYLVSSLKNYIYHYRLLILVAAVVVIVVRTLLVWGLKFPIGIFLVSIGITIVIALPFWVLLKKIFRWKTG